MRTKLLIHLKWLITFAGICLLGNMNVYSQLGQGTDAGVNFTPRTLTNGQPTVTLQGDLTIAANNILNRRTTTASANTPYNGSNSNNEFVRDYINVDPDGGNNFSSSTAKINIPNCSRIEWAGLYWSGSYIAEVYNNTGTNAIPGVDREVPRPAPADDVFQNIRFRIPGSGFVNITADDVIYNAAYGIKDRPYACYKDVTAMLQGLTGPTGANGDYTVANVRGSRGITDGGSAGWVLVVIYEDPTLPSRHITVFDGFKWISLNQDPVTFDASGFTTIPVGPVRARLAVAALEGDRGLGGDAFAIAPHDNITNFTTLGSTTAGLGNPTTNFFDATITNNFVNIPSPDRNIASSNTMGFDADIFDLENTGNGIINNGETGARFRMSTDRDSYGAFLATFAIDVIEPNIQLVKTVEAEDPDNPGSFIDITGGEVDLGDEIFYVIEFQNIGNDDATNFTIRDDLPANVTYDQALNTLQYSYPGITASYDAGTHSITFTIPDGAVVQGQPNPQEIRFSVNVVNSCFELRDACSNEINNQAFATYSGVDNPGAVISDDPSYYGFDSCDFGLEGSSNFIANIDDCDFIRDEVLCGSSIEITAGGGFTSYQWYNNVVVDGSGNVTDPGDLMSGQTNQSLTVTALGTYRVVKTAPAPCLSFDEIINVVPFTNALTNPVVTAIENGSVRGEVETEDLCFGEPFPKVYLCGVDDEAFIDTDITDAQSIIWEQLNTGSCTDPGTEDDNCPNTGNTCTWSSVHTGNDYTADTAGEFRIRVVYQNDCQRIFYFDVYTNELDPEISATDIICDTEGSITVDSPSASAGYEFQLVNNNTGTPVGAYQASNVFTGLPAGDYYVNARQTAIADGCVFPSEVEQIRERLPNPGVTVVNPACFGELGSATVQLSNVEPQYTFELINTDTNGTIVTVPAQDINFYEFTGLPAGNYSAIVRTDDGCEVPIPFSIVTTSNFTATASVSQNVTCREGNIQLHSSGGQTPHSYAIYSYNGVLTNPGGNIGDYAWQTSAIFDVVAGDEGTYQYIAIDVNNCTTLSNEVTIIVVPPMNYTVGFDHETCFGANDGTVTVNMTDPGGYTPSYSIDGGVTFQASPTFTGLAPGNYDLVVRGTRNSRVCDFPYPQITINPATQIGGTATRTQGLACPSQLGIITFTAPTGGSGDYEYSVGGAFQASQTFNNLTAGTYTPRIRDLNNPTCAITLPNIVIAPLNPPTNLDFLDSAITCNDPATDVQVNVTGGTGTITYEMTAAPGGFTIPPSNTTGNFTNLIPGTYTFRVTDANNCTYQENHTIPDVTPIVVSGVLVSNVTCFNDTDGAATYTVSGFASQYSYTIDGGAPIINQSSTSIPLTGLSVGPHEVIVTDQTTGCTDNATVTIANPPTPLDLPAPTITGITCGASGTNPGAATAAATGGWGVYSYSLEDGVGNPLQGPQGNGTFNNLVAGDYVIIVTDANGCEEQEAFTLADPIVPVLTLTPDANCYTAGNPVDVTATIGAGTGTAPFNFELNTGATNTTGVFANLTPGTYTVTVTDANGCTDDENITINPAVTVSATADDFSACDTDTEITITPGGGDGSYTFAVMNNGVAPTPGDFSATNPVTVTAIGDYDVWVQDGTGCQAMFDLSIGQDAPIVINPPATTDVLCNGATTGVIDYTGQISGGQSPYTYSINGGTTFQASPVFNNLAAGTYNVVIRDSENCEETATVTINEPAGLSATAIVSEEYTCAQEAEITINSISGGSGQYEFSINGSTWEPVGGVAAAPYTFTNTFTNGTYSIDVRDVASPTCIFTIPDIVIDPLPAEPVLSQSVAYNCDGSGDIIILPSDPNYTYQLEDLVGGVITAYQASNTFAGVAVGSYIVRVNYGAGTPALGTSCTTTIAVTVDAGNEFRAAVTGSTNITCNGDNDGTITFEVENFDPGIGFEYSVNGGGFTTSLVSPVTEPGLAPSGAPGVEIVVRDLRDITCEVTLNQVITEPTPVVAGGSVTVDATCVDGATIVATANGGIPGYEYQLEDGATIITPFNSSATFTNVPGLTTNYTIRVRDNNNCEDTFDLPVPIATPIEFEAVPELCYSGANDGTITVTIDPNSNGSAGNGNLQVSLNGGTFININTPGTPDQHIFSNLSAGTYTVDIRDGYGCTALQQTVTIDPQLLANLDATDITCNDGTITVTAQGGDGNYVYAYVLQPGGSPALGDFGASNTLIVDGTTVVAGTYNVYVRDNNGGPVGGIVDVDYCEYMETITVDTAPVVAITTSPTQPSCFGDTGSIQVNITAGDGPFTITVTDGVTPIVINNFSGTSRLFPNLTAAVGGTSYDITVTDVYGCPTPIETEILLGPDQLTAIATGVPGGCEAFEVTPDYSNFGFNIDGIPAFYTGGAYNITYSDGIIDQSGSPTSNEFRDYVPGTEYFPTVTVEHIVSGATCTFDLDPIIIPYPLDNLLIDVGDVRFDCITGLEVDVEGEDGLPPYEYSFSEDPSVDFNTLPWTAPLADGVIHTFTSADGLIPGRTYVFFVRDANGCIRQSPTDINDHIPDADISGIAAPSCDGANDGEIEFTVTDVAPNDLGVSFTWELYTLGQVVGVDAPVQTGGPVAFVSPTDFTVTSLAPNDYFVVLTGSTGCEFASPNVRVNELDPISGTPAVTQNITCSQPGIISIPDIDGGDGSYTFTLSSANFTADIVTTDNPIEVPLANIVDQTITPFTINVSVEDGEGCIMDLGDYQMTIAQNPTILVAIDNCVSPTVATITAGGTAGPFSYSSDGGTTFLDNGGVFTNLAPATYDFQIRDNSTGCVSPIDTQTVYPVLEATVDPLTAQLNCLGDPETISINVTSGSGDYDYEISGAETVGRTTLAGPFPFAYDANTAGTYTITVYDNLTNPECSRVFTVEITDAVVPVVDDVDITDATCDGDSDGSAQINLDPATVTDLPYTYTLTATTGTNALPAANESGFFSGLEAAIYDFSVVSSEGCDVTGQFTINDPDPIIVPATIVTQFACTAGNNMNNALIEVDGAGITGGSGTYVRYEFINPSAVVAQDGANPNLIVTDPAGGTYTINVYDDNGCVGTTTATIDPFTEISAPLVSVDNAVSCVAGEDITVSVTFNPGAATPNMQYDINGIDVVFTQQVNNTLNNAQFTGLPIGTYSINATNTDTGCFVTTSHTVQDPNDFDIDINIVSDVICFGGDGLVNFELIDPNGVYAGGITYEVFDQATNTSQTGGSIAFGTPGPTTPDLNLPAGDYYVEIVQTAFPECTNTRDFSIAGPSMALTAGTNVTDITCALNDGIIEVINPVGGWGGYTYFVDLASNPAPTFPGSYQASPVFSGLGAETYQVWIADQNGCEQQILPNITLSDPTPLSANLEVSQANCNGNDGEVTVTGLAGGIGPDFTYQLQTGAGVNIGGIQNTGVFSGLGAGTYQVYIEDQFNCFVTTNTVTLLSPINAVAGLTADLTCARNDGEITVTVTGGSGNFQYDVITPISATPLSNATGVFTGLDEAGLYTITVTDLDTAVPGPACTVTAEATITEPVDPVIDNIATEDVSCDGGNDGVVTITITDATNDDPPYTYTITSAPGTYGGPMVSTNGIFNELTAGTYDFTVESAISCTVSDQFVIDEPPALSATAAVTQEFACDATNGAATGEITVTVDAVDTGTAPYVYSLNGINFFDNGGVFEIADTGVDQTFNNIIVRDANGCTFPVPPVTITALPRMILGTTLIDPITCTNTGETITVDVTNLPLPTDLVFEVLGEGIIQANNPTIILPDVGTYTIRVTDVNTGCFETIEYTVAPYDTIAVEALNATPVTCVSDSDGTMEINVTGYTGTYDYVVLDDTGTPTLIVGSGDTATDPQTITGLAAGNYTVEVTATATPFCDAVSNNITIPGPSLPLDMTLELMEPITCVGGDGAIRAIATGGWNTSYSYTITYPVSGTTATNSTGIFQNLDEEGNYTVDVTDAGGCTIQRTLNIDVPVAIVINDISAIPLVCEGDTDGTITVDVDPTTGRGPAFFQYILINEDTGAISDSQSSNIFTNLAAGNYSVQVIDGWDCDATAGPVTITEPTEVVASLVQLSPLTCENDARIQVTASGGTGPYEYSTSQTGPWSPTNIFDVGVGQYQYYAQDAVGCISEVSNSITYEPITPLQIVIDDSAANLACFSDTDAVIRATATGGLGQYMYELYDTNVNPASPAIAPIVAAQSSGIFSDLGVGSYYVRVISVDCYDVSEEIIITEPTPLVEGDYGSTNPTCTGEGDGQIVYPVSGGTGTIKYAITPDLDQFDVNFTFNNLSPGTYTVIAQDENGCYMTRDFTIVDPVQLTVTPGTLQQELCTGDLDGAIEVLIEGGTAPYTAAITYPGDATDPLVFEPVADNGDPTIPSPHTFGGLAGGITYTIFIEDANGCTSNVDIALDPSFDLTAGVTVEYGCTDNFSTNTVTVSVVDPTAAAEDLIYVLDGLGAGQLENVFFNVPPGDHFIEILAPNGCVNNDPDQVAFNILAIEDLGIEIFESNLNEFTYNGTGGVPPYEYYVDGEFQGTDNIYRINRTDTYTVRVVDSNGCEFTDTIFIEFYDIEVPPVFTPDNDGINDEWEIINDEGFPNMVTKVYDRYGRWLATMRPGDTWNGMYDGKPLPSGDYWYVIKINGENDPREFIGHFTLYR